MPTSSHPCLSTNNRKYCSSFFFFYLFRPEEDEACADLGLGRDVVRGRTLLTGVFGFVARIRLNQVDENKKKIFYCLIFSEISLRWIWSQANSSIRRTVLSLGKSM